MCWAGSDPGLAVVLSPNSRLVGQRVAEAAYRIGCRDHRGPGMGKAPGAAAVVAAGGGQPLLLAEPGREASDTPGQRPPCGRGRTKGTKRATLALENPFPQPHPLGFMPLDSMACLDAVTWGSGVEVCHRNQTKHKSSILEETSGL